MPKRQALGRGLDALLSMDDIKTEGSSSINEIELTKIKVNPNQPRREFDEDALQELASSIAEIGIIQPITLRKMSDDEYQIIAGERRFRASQKAGLTAIPAYIRTADDENVMDDIAEQGFAAHWKYKEGGDGSEDEGELEKWLHTVKEILDDPVPDAIDFLDAIKLNLFASEIFAFTPKGELKTMPQNSTTLDFAFMLHTDIGMLTVAISDELVAKGLKAGMMVKEAAKLIQGGGGGQPHFAQAGGKNKDGLREAVNKIIELANL